MIFNLNPEQDACTKAIDGVWVTVAGPGSGKTAVLIRRYLDMITVHGIPSKDILNLTFTNAAATEMVERVGLTDAKNVFRTFHSFALDLVMKEKQYLPFKAADFILPQYGQDYELIRSLVKMYPAITSFRDLREKLSGWKASNIDPEQAIDDASQAKGTEFFYALAYRDYEKKCREQGWLDFDSLMKETVKLLETNDEVRVRHQRKYIAVDEAQDCDRIQFRLLQLIYGGNIFAVGDENQLIYEFRSAVVGSLTNFSDYFPGTKILFLGRNYRSVGALVDFFKKIVPVDNGIASHMVSNREVGRGPSFTRFDDDIQEAVAVLAKVTDLNNTAIIARTNRQLRTIQKAAMARGIKTMILGQKDLWQKDEVKHLLELTKKHPHGHRPAYDVMTEIMNQNNLTHIYRDTGGPNEKPPVENLADIIKLSANRGSVSEFLTWLRKLTYACEAAKDPQYKLREKNPTLALTTVHQAKGREWKHVFVIGVNQGLMPHKDGEFLEEKRIWFVACSRAADTLDVSYWGNRSEFLNDFQQEIKSYEP